MSGWENLPMELLTHLYQYLSRRDRLSCSLVCQNWKDALDHVILWKSLTVHLDTDLMEPSTILMLRDYCKYVKNLEFGWAIPHKTHKWVPQRHKQFTKRAVRLFIILYDSYIQVTSLRIFNWFDFVSFQKVAYHISRFLGNQLYLEKLIFDNINMHSANYMQILTSCLSSKGSITHLDIRSCYYCQSSFNSVYFRSCIEQLSQLKTFKLDYFILSCNLIDSIITSKNRSLECLELVLKDTWHSRIIDEHQWFLLKKNCPKLKVTLTIRNVYQYDELKHYFKQSIPVVSISIALPRLLERGDRCQIKKTLNLIVNYYRNTLEIFDLHVKNDAENLDDTLLMLLRRCKKLKSLIFNGIIEYPKMMIDSFRNEACLCILSVFPESQLAVNKLYTECLEESELRHKRVQFTIFRTIMNSTMCSMLILN